MDYNIYGSIEDSDISQEQQEKLYGKVEKADGIKESTVVKHQICNIAQGDYTKEALEDMNGVYDSIEGGGGRFIYLHFTPIPDDQYRAYVKEQGLSYEDAKEKGDYLR